MSEDLTEMSSADLAALQDRVDFEQLVRSILDPPCMVFMSPGPPWYAARCRKPAGHDDDHDFGTVEEAQESWGRSATSHMDRWELAQREAERRAGVGW